MPCGRKPVDDAEPGDPDDAPRIDVGYGVGDVSGNLVHRAHSSIRFSGSDAAPSRRDRIFAAYSIGDLLPRRSLWEASPRRTSA
jgi:hypothetical protein